MPKDNVYKDLKEESIPILPLINNFTQTILKNIHRRLTIKQSYFKPWTFRFSVPVYCSIFFKVSNVLQWPLWFFQHCTLATATLITHSAVSSIWVTCIRHMIEHFLLGEIEYLATVYCYYPKCQSECSMNNKLEYFWHYMYFSSAVYKSKFNLCDKNF